MVMASSKLMVTSMMENMLKIINLGKEYILIQMETNIRVGLKMTCLMEKGHIFMQMGHKSVVIGLMESLKGKEMDWKESSKGKSMAMSREFIDTIILLSKCIILWITNYIKTLTITIYLLSTPKISK